MKIGILLISIVLAFFLVGIYFYPQMPEKMATHWNASGVADGFMTKDWGVFLLPIISVVLLALFLFIPRLDPLKQNIEKFRKNYDYFIIIFMLFFLYVYLLTILWNLGFEFNLGKLMIPALAVLFFYIGMMLEKAKMNWFIGIRTPWTLSSEKVWDKTHRLGAKLLKVAAIITFFGVFFSELAPFFIIVPVLVVFGFTFVYSYLEYQKEKK